MFPDPQADIGQHTFKFGLYPHNGSFAQSQVIEVAELFNNPLQVVNGYADFSLPVQIKEKNIAISCIKKAEDSNSFIIRLFECHGGKTHVDLSNVFPTSQMILCNLIEDEIRDILADERSAFMFNPYEIHTIKIACVPEHADWS